MKLWLDDIFDYSVSAVKPKDTDWLWAKNFDQFKQLLENHEKDIQLISFDNDLGEDLEGKHCFYLMEELLSEGKLRNLKNVILHSDNISAVTSMLGAKNYLKSIYGIEVQKFRRITEKKENKPAI